MKHIVILALYIFILLSAKAQHQIIPMNGSYIKFPYIIKTSKPYDEVWSNIIRLLQVNDMSGKILVKRTLGRVFQSNNLIVTCEYK